MDLGSCKFYGSVKSKRSDAASAVDVGDDGGEVSVLVWEGADRRRDGQTCIKRLKVRKEENKQINCNNCGFPYLPGIGTARPFWFGTPINKQECSLVNVFKCREHTLFSWALFYYLLRRLCAIQQS